MPDSWNIGTMKNISHDADGRLKSMFCLYFPLDNETLFE